MARDPKTRKKNDTDGEDFRTAKSCSRSGGECTAHVELAIVFPAVCVSLGVYSAYRLHIVPRVS